MNNKKYNEYALIFKNSFGIQLDQKNIDLYLIYIIEILWLRYLFMISLKNRVSWI